MRLSSRSFRGALICGVVALHGPEDVDAAARQRQYGLSVMFALSAFTVVVRPGLGAGFNAVVGGQVEDAQQSTVVSAGSFEVPADSSGVARYRCQAGDGGEPVGTVEAVQAAVGGRDELGSQQRTESRHTADHCGLLVLSESFLDHVVEIGQLRVDVEDLLGNAGDDRRAEALAGHDDVLRIGGGDRTIGDGDRVVGVAAAEPFL